jgi:hypothetical protein
MTSFGKNSPLDLNELVSIGRFRQLSEKIGNLKPSDNLPSPQIQPLQFTIYIPFLTKLQKKIPPQKICPYDIRKQHIFKILSSFDKS